MSKRTNKAKSIEEKIEDWAKQQLANCGVKYYIKTDPINSSIDDALRAAPSKSGGDGNNFPDVKCLIECPGCRRIPVMIEAKGVKGKLIKRDKEGNIVGVTVGKNGKENWSAVSGYAVNGAVHYSEAILDGGHYTETIAIGVNGFDNGNETVYEVEAYYIAEKNGRLPKRVAELDDLTFLSKATLLGARLDDLILTAEERADIQYRIEVELDKRLRTINQLMQDTLQINVNHRVNLISGLIMAGLGADKVPPLKSTELQGLRTRKGNDGQVVMGRIEDFLESKSLPFEKRDMISRMLSTVFLDDQLSLPENGETKLKQLYRRIESEIMPLFKSEVHIDFTGKLFNVLNEWVSVPDGDRNDVVLTPRYVTELMAKLCWVDSDSYVWDYATGSGGFLVSSMKLMLEDARRKFEGAELQKKKTTSKCFSCLVSKSCQTSIYWQYST